MIGVTTANFRGEAKKTPINSDTIEKILSLFPEISPRWLISGVAPMMVAEDESILQSESNNFPEIIKNLSEANRKLTETNSKLVERVLSCH